MGFNSGFKGLIAVGQRLSLTREKCYL